MRRLMFLLAVLCAACAEQTQFTKPGVTAAQAEQDRRHCLGTMYSERTAHGKGAPNWSIFDYCMKSRGYARESAGRG